MGLGDTATYNREELLDIYLEAFINRSDPDNIDKARKEIEEVFINSLTDITINEILYLIKTHSYEVVYNPHYDEFQMNEAPIDASL